MQRPLFDNPDEQYVYDERLAILIQGTREPTLAEIRLAEADVERFRRETNEQVEMI